MVGGCVMYLTLEYGLKGCFVLRFSDAYELVLCVKLENYRH